MMTLLLISWGQSVEWQSSSSGQECQDTKDTRTERYKRKRAKRSNREGESKRVYGDCKRREINGRKNTNCILLQLLFRESEGRKVIAMLFVKVSPRNKQYIPCTRVTPRKKFLVQSMSNWDVEIRSIYWGMRWDFVQVSLYKGENFVLKISRT
uniref:Uncharacterized protein n=1 Tax=Cacopsylla melanoneura TaxID=428564 RepID=A0A8D8WHS6_9HEMI